MAAMKRAVLASDTPAVRVSCKIRLAPDLATTIQLAQRLEAAGCGLLAVHCRGRRDQHDGPPDLRAGAALVSALHIPVVINGGVWSDACARRVLAATGAHAVMVAQGFLANPRCMDPTPEPWLAAAAAAAAQTGCGGGGAATADAATAADLAAEYLDFAEAYPPPTAAYVRKHLRWILRGHLQPGAGADADAVAGAHGRGGAWRPRLWLYLSREVLSSVWQFRQCVHLFCVLNPDVGTRRTPASLGP